MLGPIMVQSTSWEVKLSLSSPSAVEADAQLFLTLVDCPARECRCLSHLDPLVSDLKIPPRCPLVFNFYVIFCIRLQQMVHHFEGEAQEMPP